jgi:hypothetical protein
VINYLTLSKKLAPYKVTNDTDLPWAYQTANPKGRPLHDDWVLGKKIRRIDTAFRIPLPLVKVAGNAEPEWVPILRPELWTFAPGAKVEMRPYQDHLEPTPMIVPWVLTMTSGQPAGQWSRQAAYLGGEWVECYYTRSMNVFGNKLFIYGGLKIDVNPRDLMVWWPEFSGSIKWNWLG